MPDSEKTIESRLEEGCYYLLFDSRSTRGSNDDVRRWVSHALAPIHLLYSAGEQNQQYWFPAYSLLPRWHHTRPQPIGGKTARLETITLTFYRYHVEHRVISNIMVKLLAAYGVKLEVKEVSYDKWHRGKPKVTSGLTALTSPCRLNSHSIRISTRCRLSRNASTDTRKWQKGELSLPEWCQQRVEQNDILPLIHHWLRIEGQRSMRGVRMNTLGWFDFKSAWFAPPEP